MSYPERTVVTGAGLAGFRTVEELRRRGYSGQLTLIGAEDRPPYDRPPLSKRVLTDGIDPSLKADFASLDAALPRPAPDPPPPASPPAPPARPRPPPSPCIRLPRATLITNRDKYAFDHLVIATGSVPVTLPGPGPQRVLRTYDDALALRALLRPGLRLAIVGAGWIGAELATAAAAAGCQVTVVEAGPAPLAGALGAATGARTAPWYEQAGVELRTGTAVESVERGGLALAGGWLAADEIVTAVGVRPAVSWLAGSGLVLDNGVAVDPGLRASLPGVYAAGDCAAFASLRFGVRLRVEHWETALHAPEVVAANIAGGAEVYDPVPYFWSEQFGRMVQYAGHHRRRRPPRLARRPGRRHLVGLLAVRGHAPADRGADREPPPRPAAGPPLDRGRRRGRRRPPRRSRRRGQGRCPASTPSIWARVEVRLMAGYARLGRRYDEGRGRGLAVEDRIEQRVTVRATVDAVLAACHAARLVAARQQGRAGPRSGTGDRGVRDDKRPYVVDVVRVEPKGYVSYRWASAFGGAAPAPGRSTLVEFYVRPAGDEVGVTVVESGFASLDLPDALREDEWKGNSGGWQYEMAALRARVEQGALTAATGRSPGAKMPYCAEMSLVWEPPGRGKLVSWHR